MLVKVTLCGNIIAILVTNHQAMTSHPAMMLGDLGSNRVYISNYIHYNVRDEITYPFPNLTVEVWEWISNLSHTL